MSGKKVSTIGLSNMTKGVRTITKDTKIILLYFLILFTAIFALIVLSDDFKVNIAKLESEIEELDLQIENLLRQKQLYEEILELREELEINLTQQIELLEKENEDIQEENKRLEKIKSPSRGGTSREFTVTCYDLSVQSCGKPIGSKGYGITASGFDLTGHTWETARAIAVDPKVIPLGSKVEITFIDEDYSKYNSTYTAVDTGSAIKGNKIDFFLGDFNQNKVHQSVWEFGKTKAVVKILE